MNAAYPIPCKPKIFPRDISRYLAAIMVLLLVGCAQPQKPLVVSKPQHYPAHEKAPKPAPKPLTGLPLVSSLLPTQLPDKEGWAADIHDAFVTNKIVVDKSNVCAVVAEIEQESSFQANPRIPGLNEIVQRELEKRRQKYHIPQWLMNNALASSSTDGKTYNERIAALKTETDVSQLYQDMISEIPFGKRLLEDYNPVHTGGPMQVSMSFASAYLAKQPYPYPQDGSLREKLFSRKGGLYFGVAYLLAYPASYDKLEFRFADFNAGSYSSRNAAFQHAVSILSGVKLMQDGDLLRYQDDVAVAQPPSQTMLALLRIAQRLGLQPQEIQRDLLLEKSYEFEQSPLYQKVYALLPAMERASIPKIELSTPKATRKLTTANYVRRVKQRYRDCMDH